MSLADRMSDLVAAVRAALAGVIDPEIRRPITELGMVDSVVAQPDGRVDVRVLLTIAGCPMQSTIEADVNAAVLGVAGVTALNLELGTMSDEQRAALKKQLRGGVAEREIPFAQPDNRTQVILVASGKGGVGKSSVTVNLAMALAGHGKRVGVLDADIYGHSIPQMLGLVDANPTSVDGMILPVPALGMQVISIGMLKESRDQVIAWRGPILDRALQQFLADVYWGDLDFLLVDLPPGTGDVALSLGQKLPNAEVLVVTTPQQAAAEVAERAGTMASMLDQRVIGVVENMAYLDRHLPALRPDASGRRLRLRRRTGGRRARSPSASATTCRCSPRVPMDPAMASRRRRGRAAGGHRPPIRPAAAEWPTCRAPAERPREPQAQPGRAQTRRHPGRLSRRNLSWRDRMAASLANCGSAVAFPGWGPHGLGWERDCNPPHRPGRPRLLGPIHRQVQGARCRRAVPRSGGRSRALGQGGIPATDCHGTEQ